MKKIIIITEVGDDYEPGCCLECPFSYEEWYENDGESDVDFYCVLHKSYKDCPVTIMDNN